MSEIVRFAKFDGGNIVQAEAQFVELSDKALVVSHDGELVRFNRTPGSKSGYGIGKAKTWRLSAEDRKKYCLPDLSYRR